MEYKFKPRGVCSQSLSFEIEDNKLKNVSFYGGCNGNLKGIATLVEGMPIDQVRDKLSGIKCGYKTTSCPDQLAQALNQILDPKE
ncbi:TIGR03905 family TSCPD domain-containing protein [Aminipila terrae]|uniref:ribonucleoside-diphosphate reductase n=1 Tax=Aminipila terrae TaxID=2697030 RepID=A0A6P1MI91_9FIRM|nr:TIGR03905 family TSCPD domain-containing protein [Aminipila terrae]QHI72324.1 TIGR03905 family TSCPD domain-containing protein [Aminipila terrae]